MKKTTTYQVSEPLIRWTMYIQELAQGGDLEYEILNPIIIVGVPQRYYWCTLLQTFY